MKMRRTITTLLASMLLCFAFAACEKEDTTTSGNNGGGNNNGPVITDDDTGIELNMSNNGNDKIYFETVYIWGNSSTDNAQIYLAMSLSNNFYLTLLYGNMEYDIARVGTVAGMSSINSIPTSGWVKQIAVNPGTGYVIRYKGQGFGYTYARLYVKDWIVSTGGGIIGATVIYQDKWGQGPEEDALVGTKWRYIENYQSEVTIEFLSGNSGLCKWVDYNYENNNYEETFTYIYSNTYGTITFSDGEQWNFHYEGNQLTIEGTIFSKI